MSSVITTTVSHASSHIAQPSNSAASGKEGASQGNTNVNQVAQVSQAAAEKASEKVKNDKNRAASLKKKTEGSFSSQDDKPDSQDNSASKAVGKKKQGAPKTGQRVNVSV